MASERAASLPLSLLSSLVIPLFSNDGQFEIDDPVTNANLGGAPVVVVAWQGYAEAELIKYPAEAAVGTGIHPLCLAVDLDLALGHMHGEILLGKALCWCAVGLCDLVGVLV